MAARKSAKKKSGSKKQPARKQAPAGKSPRRTASGFRLATRALAVVALLAGFWASTWVLEQDRIVVQRFEGRRFEVPSKVLSAPTILYPGLDWKRIELPRTLERLGYRELKSTGEIPPGRYRWAAAAASAVVPAPVAPGAGALRVDAARRQLHRLDPRGEDRTGSRRCAARARARGRLLRARP
jgi:hypothetical protein